MADTSFYSMETDQPQQIYVQEQKFTLTPEQVKCLRLIEENKVVTNSDEPLKITNFTPVLFSEMLKLLKVANYDFPDYPPINSNILKDFIKPEVAAILQSKTLKELNELYNICFFCICDGLRKFVVAAVACRVYFQPTLEEYRKKKDEMGIKRDLSETMLQKFKEKYPFCS